MKKTLKIGAYGWCHSHWLNTFYPDDLPMSSEEDWRLAYYSNEFTTVLVPASYWQLNNQQGQIVDCERWLDDVNDEFQFFIECHDSMLEHVSMDEVTRQLNILQPQLSGLVLLGTASKTSKASCKQFLDLADELMTDVFSDNAVVDSAGKTPINEIWRQSNPGATSLAIIEDDLTNLRAVRTIVDEFMSDTTNIGQKSNEATMFVQHQNLQPMDLSQFRAVAEIMGY